MNQTLVYTLWLWKESYKKKEFAPSDFVAKGVIMDFYGIFVYMRRGAGVLSFICRDGAFGRIVVASSMDRNYRGAISPSQRARSASVSTSKRRMFFFVTGRGSTQIQTPNVLFCFRHPRAHKINKGDHLAASIVLCVVV
jgi:hypothetical protein